MDCPLCHTDDNPEFYRNSLHHFLKCRRCDGLYRTQENIPDSEAEKARYQTHNNDVTDSGYRNFVRPLVRYVQNKFLPESSLGLDFGAGTGPVIAVMLQEASYSINLYDPYFHRNPDVLAFTYDYIICCEVMEHFNRPDMELKKLRELLKPGGSLICKTDLYTDDIEFDTWYYKNDPTHVFIYCSTTLDWIASNYGFTLSFIDKRSPVFSLPA